MTTIKDVARHAQVSFTTVSHVINETRPVSPDTADRVRRAISELGYVPSDVARALKSNRTRIIGMIVTSTTNPFFGEVIGGAERVCFDSGYSLMLCNTDDVEQRLTAYVKTLLSKRIDALVVMTTNASPDFLRRLGQIRRLPVVAIDAAPGTAACVVNDDSRRGGALAVDMLIGRGFRDIAFVWGPEAHPRARERLEGAHAALRRHGLDPAAAAIRRGPLTIAGGQAAAAQLLDGPPERRPQAIFACNDLMAVGVLHEAHRLGVAVPDALSIVGYDDIEFAAHTFPPLTTIHQPAAEIGAAAVTSLIRHLENGAELPRDAALPPTLVMRDSVAPRAPSVEAQHMLHVVS